MPITLASNALTSLNKVKAYGVSADQTSTGDQVIVTLINMASTMIHEWCEREFKSTLGTGSRNFAYTGNNWLSFGKWDAQSVSAVTIDSDLTSVSTLPTSQYQLVPIEQPHGVYRGIKLFSYTIGDPLRVSAGMDRQMTVTGTWGFASVPADVEMACIITVVLWLRRDLQYLTRTFNIAEDHIERPDALPSAALSLLRPYKRIR